MSSASPGDRDNQSANRYAASRCGNICASKRRRFSSLGAVNKDPLTTQTSVLTEGRLSRPAVYSTGTPYFFMDFEAAASGSASAKKPQAGLVLRKLKAAI